MGPANGRYRRLLQMQCLNLTGRFPPSTSMARQMLRAALRSAMRLEQLSAPRGLNDRFAPALVYPARLNLLIVFQRGAGLARSAFQSRFSLKRCHRSLCAVAIRALPASVFGPVERPPWYLQRRLPGMTLFLQAAPDLARAPHCGRSLGGRGRPSSFSPICCMRAQTTLVHSSHTFLKSG